MGAVVVIQSSGVTSTGSDVTPTALAFNDISAANGSPGPLGTTNTETIAAIDTPITLRAAFTAGGDPVQGSWVKNGVVQGYGASPRDVSFSLGDTIAFYMRFTGAGRPLFAAGTVAFTNQSDSGATVAPSISYDLERF